MRAFAVPLLLAVTLVAEHATPAHAMLSMDHGAPPGSGRVAQTTTLSCTLTGTPATRPNDLVISNGGRTAVPRGTKLFWQVAGSGEVGFVKLMTDLRPGERRAFNDVLERGQPVGAACGVSLGVTRVTKVLSEGMLGRRLECIIMAPEMLPLPGWEPAYILGVYNASARALPAGTHVDFAVGALKGRRTLDDPLPIGGEAQLASFTVSSLQADPDTVTCRISVGT
jgi:hypothetical protein